MIIGSKLAALRDDRDMSLTDLSELVGISKSTLSRLERGMHQPSMKTLRYICSALGWEAKELLEIQEHGDQTKGTENKKGRA